MFSLQLTICSAIKVFRAGLKTSLFSWCFWALRWPTISVHAQTRLPPKFSTVIWTSTRQKTTKESFNVKFKSSKILSNVHLQSCFIQETWQNQHTYKNKPASINSQNSLFFASWGFVLNSNNPSFLESAPKMISVILPSCGKLKQLHLSNQETEVWNLNNFHKRC